MSTEVKEHVGVKEHADNDQLHDVQHANIDPKWQSLQMLPDSFIQRRKTKRVLYAWFCVLFTLLALLCGMTTAFYIGAKKTTRKNANLVTQAEPLMQIRHETTKLKQQNLKCGNLCRLVKSARPDDSLLQALAAVSLATAAGENEIDVKTVSIKLGLETPNTAKLVPVWAKPHLQITADVVGQETARAWVERINASSRTSSVELRQTNIGRWIDGTVQVIGESTATRVLP